MTLAYTNAAAIAQMLERAFDRTLDRTLDRSLPTNIVNHNDVFELSIKVPGVSRNDIAVDIDGRTVTVTVNKETPVEAVGVTSSKPTGVPVLAEYNVPVKAERVFQFREMLDAESASLVLADGILTIKVAQLLRGNKRTLKPEA